MVLSAGIEFATKKQHLRVCLFIFENDFFGIRFLKIVSLSQCPTEN